MQFLDIFMSDDGKLRFAIAGYGRMGRAIEDALKERGEEAPLIFSRYDDVDKNSLNGIDSVFCFFPYSSLADETTRRSLDCGVDVILGTTGLEKVGIYGSASLCLDNKGLFLYERNVSIFRNLGLENNSGVLYSPNFSIAANRFIQRAVDTARDLRGDFDIAVHEVHNSKKRDAPSGTAQLIAAKLEEVCGKNIPLTTQRLGGEPGTHIVTFSSQDETIVQIHVGRERRAFANGAIDCAYWLSRQNPGVYRMDDFMKDLK